MSQAVLDHITELSHRFGGPAFVKGGGGNTSAKDDTTLWVKPSGTTLGGLRPERFVPIDRAKLGDVYAWQPPADARERESKVKDLMIAAVIEGDGRPSVETPLHDSFSARYVVHTHMTLCNGLTCAIAGKAAAAKLFPEAMWVEYVDPGYVLAMDVRQRIHAFANANGHEPSIVLLDNHGIFVAGDTPEQIDEAYAHVQQVLESAYASAGVTASLSPGVADQVTVAAAKPILAEALGDEGQYVAACGRFAAPAGPITPDHVVYARSYPLVGPVTRESIDAYKQKHGMTPRVFVTPNAVLAVGTTPERAQLALDMAIDGAQIQQLAQTWGGIDYLTDAQRVFIEQWEVEAFRATQV